VQRAAEGKYRVRAVMTVKEVGTCSDAGWKRGVHIEFPDGHSV
jgi:hypothetical protein